MFGRNYWNLLNRVLRAGCFVGAAISGIGLSSSALACVDGHNHQYIEETCNNSASSCSGETEKIEECTTATVYGTCDGVNNLSISCSTPDIDIKCEDASYNGSEACECNPGGWGDTYKIKYHITCPG